jgi:DNA-binding NarL/FixJ family response regulator
MTHLCSRQLSHRMAKTGHTPAPSAAWASYGLSAREVEVMTLIARGLTNIEIAEDLFISQTTVKTHVARVLAKLRARNRVQVVVLAYESGLVRVRRAG